MQHGMRGAGKGNRTLVLSLEGFSSTIELPPHRYISKKNVPHFLISTFGAGINIWGHASILQRINTLSKHEDK